MFALRTMTLKQSFGMRYQIRKQSGGIHYFFKKQLFFTNSLTSGLCMCVGDLIQQEMEYHAGALPDGRRDWARAGRMFLMGLSLGPLHHYYYIYLDKLLPSVSLKTVLLKIGADQAFVSPITLIVFIHGMSLLEGKTFDESTGEVVKKFPYAYIGDCLFWPPIQFINFYFLPTHYRVLYINVATVIFNIYLSYIKHYDRNR